MKLYFVRHGQSVHNAKNLHQPSHSTLSGRGLEQAESVAEKLLNYPIEIIISSTFERTKQTAEIINKKINKEIVFSELVREITRPSETIGMNADSEDVLRIKDSIFEHMNEASWHYSDEENFFELRERAIKAISFLSKIQKENILVVTHGTFLRYILGIMMFGEQMEPAEYKKLENFFRTKNTGITICEKDGENWKLLTWNDHAHLKAK